MKTTTHPPGAHPFQLLKFPANKLQQRPIAPTAALPTTQRQQIDDIIWRLVQLAGDAERAGGAARVIRITDNMLRSFGY